jgi:methylated-DNA-[protein]-cysteine S-methyltransferase
MLETIAADTLLVFPTELGWMAAIHADRVLHRLAFGHPDADAAHAAADAELGRKVRLDEWERRLVKRFQAYAEGEPEDFRDLQIDLGRLGPFQRRVYAACREIRYGRVRTYGELASAAGSPQAARAVGNCMARNRLPLVVPCHRVIGASSNLGGYSAPGGLAVKRRLLELEGFCCRGLTQDARI